MRRLLLLSALAACGRLAFEPVGDSGRTGDGGTGDGDPVATHNVAFVSAQTYTTDQLGAVTADAICTTLASDAGLPPGPYVAWISESSSTALSRLGSARGWVRVDGRPFADTVANIAAGEILHPLTLEPSGVAHSELVATGTHFDGSVAQDCNGWSTTSGGSNIRVGLSDSTTYGWTDSAIVGCDTAFPIYCLGTARAVPLPARSLAGRRAFITPNPEQLSGGRAQADSLCAGYATGAGLVGTFLAYLATSTESAAARFSPAGPPWMRLNGVLLADTAAELLGAGGGGPITPLNLSSTLTYLPDVFVHTGAPGPDAVGSMSCGDWTDTSAATMHPVGKANVVEGWFFDTVAGCDEYYHHYCFEL